MDRDNILLFVDTETTGLTREDRVISLGMVELDLETGATSCRHLIFNPGRPSNPFAAAVHGYDDWTLKHQPLFADHAESLVEPFDRAGRIFAHNAAFDERFLKTEFAIAGLTLADRRFDCTLKAYKRKHNLPGGLDKVLDHMGLPTRGKQHGALEDAWFCMRVWLWLNDLPLPAMPNDLNRQPENWIEPEMKPIRGMRKILGSV
ncbi:3'-5' exonuclease [Rhizobium alvei]|uniref:3'-5' exonuclease n=1 Tax=Rhizobium alvei TaxID=1132659 RepID=A0ABT8YP68_9HYPH|nr:3'-5' exonuclease [Rhizobium alvei]MDO6965518.1 3'-5' exonuclease [Rhizobium alvei]